METTLEVVTTRPGRREIHCIHPVRAAWMMPEKTKFRGLSEAGGELVDVSGQY